MGQVKGKYHVLFFGVVEYVTKRKKRSSVNVIFLAENM